jgi:AraC family transcriptional regulator
MISPMDGGNDGSVTNPDSALRRQVADGFAQLQETSNAIDRLAASILGLDRSDLPCMTLLLFGGPAPVDCLARALHVPVAEVRNAVARLEMAGYARRRAGADGAAIELTPHAREWIARIWEPLSRRGDEELARFSRLELQAIARLLQTARDVQEQHAEELRRWLDEPASARKSHQRGGLSPAALRRVQAFVEGHLDGPLHISDLAARAGLSVHHFARAFRTSTGLTPRAFVEARRIARARTLIEETDQPLADIAGATGFTSQSHLTTAFRRASGFTPAAYRRLRREDV